MYCIRYEKTIPPWIIGEAEVEAETSEDAVKEFYKRHDPFEERVTHVSRSLYTYQ